MAHAHAAAGRDFARTPMNVYWEMTQACPLACRHCRADAMPDRHPLELGFAESVVFLRQLAGFDHPLPQLVLTGGDPLSRSDLPALVEEARALGLPLAITPAASPRLTREVLAALKAQGITALGLSLDASTAAMHDGIRGVPGCFDVTVQAMRWARDLELPLQVNTLVTADTAHDLPATYALLRTHAVTRWSLFFLIPVGRGSMLTPLSPEDGERLMRWLVERSFEAPFAIATTEAPSYRRVVLETLRARGLGPAEVRQHPVTRGFGVRDGNGICFVSNTGDVFPAGFLPLAAGNVRTDDIVRLYREAPLFRALREPEGFSGKCGRCEYARVCGGSRARAYAAGGDPLGSDPFCPYEPGRARVSSPSA